LSKTDASKAPPLLWKMMDGDQPRGWSAVGAGSHKLRQVWIRPSALQLQADVQLHLAARFSQANQVDAARSSISLKINDQPLATYSLAEWKAGHAKIRIPASLWRSSVWVMDFEVRMVPQATQRCSYLIQDDLWVAIDPETRLEAKFKYEEASGIAGFWQQAIRRTVQPVFWNAASGLPNANEMTDLIPLLLAFVDADRPVPLRWAFVDQTACKSSQCIVIHPASAPSQNDGAVLPWRSALTRVPDQAKGLPDLNLRGTAVIVWQARAANSDERLHIVLGAANNQPLPVPQIATFAGPIAIHTDRWQFFSSAAELAASAPGAIAMTPGNTSQQQGRLRWVNLIWALASLVIVTSLAIVYWRKKKKVDPKTWEVE
jgi:hypothetical protein